MKELKYIIAIGVILLVHSCANRGTPSGGEYDRTPPVVLESSPENFTNNFTSSEINILFDEYIKIRNLWYFVSNYLSIRIKIIGFI